MKGEGPTAHLRQHGDGVAVYGYEYPQARDSISRRANGRTCASTASPLRRMAWRAPAGERRERRRGRERERERDREIERYML